MKILSKSGEEVIYNPDEPVELSTAVKNKKFLTISDINQDTHDEGKSFNNGQDYQWGVRLYNQVPGSTEQPNTSVCDGYLVGSTKSVIWSRIPEDEALRNLLIDYFKIPEQPEDPTEDPIPARYETEVVDSVFAAYGIVTRKSIQKLVDDINNSVITTEAKKEERINNIVTEQNDGILDQVVYDRYLEFKTEESEKDKLIIGAKEDASKKLPTNYPYVKRIKIDWVDKKLGTDKDIMKIEMTDEFDYDYEDGTPYKIYQCSDEHTVNSFFADPNSNINISNYVVIYNSVEDARAAAQAGEDPSTETPTIIPVFPARKIVGYSSDTGEVRVSDAFDYAPLNGMAYRIFEFDPILKKYTEHTPEMAIESYTPTTEEYYEIKGILNNGDEYYDDETFTNPKTILDTTGANFQFDNIGYSEFTSGGATYYINTPETYQVPTGTEYYKDKDKTEYGGVTGYTYDMKSVDVSTVKIDDTVYYIETPTTNKISKGTVYYTDTALTKVGGVYGADYTVKSEKYSNIKVGNKTYKIKTPQTGIVEKGTIFFTDKKFKTFGGIYGADYELVDKNTAKTTWGWFTYYIKTSDLKKEVVPGTMFYNDSALTQKGGFLPGVLNYSYSINDTTYSTITTAGTYSGKFIATPKSGVVENSSGTAVNIYKDKETSKLIGEVRPYRNSSSPYEITYNFGNMTYSTITNGGSTVYIKTPTSGEVITTSGDVEYYEDTTKRWHEEVVVGKVKPYRVSGATITYTVNDYNYSTSSTSTSADQQYIKTPKTDYVPYDTEYFYEESLDPTQSAGNIRLTKTDFSFLNNTTCEFKKDLKTRYFDIPSSSTMFLSLNTPYYSSDWISNIWDPTTQGEEYRIGFTSSSVEYSFKNFIDSSTDACYTLVINEVTYYTKKPYVGITDDYYEAEYVGTYVSGSTEVKYYKITVNEIEYYVKDNIEMTPVIPVDYYSTQVIGGKPIVDPSFIVLSNKWDQYTKRLFIQPNINIKTDYTNPNELVFTSGDNNKIRIDINKVEEYNEDTQKYVDISINKLDNTQWLLENDSLNLVQESLPSGMIYPKMIPQTDYTIYTSFMDSLPFNVFYARRSPSINIRFKNLDAGNSVYNDVTEHSVRPKAKYYKDQSFTEYVGITDQRYSCDVITEGACYAISIDGITYYVKYKEDSSATKNINDFFGIRDAVFKTDWESIDDTLLPQVKYYKYTLSSMDYYSPRVIAESEDKYNTELEWSFRGLDGAPSLAFTESKPHRYKIRIDICDEYDKAYYSESEFGIYYVTESGSNSLEVGDVNGEKYLCEENCLNVSINAPTIIGTFNSYKINSSGAKEKYTRTVDVIQRGASTQITTDTYPDDLSLKDTVFYTADDKTAIDNKALVIEEGEVLNYSKAYETDGDIQPYDLPVTLGTYAELQVNYDFIKSIPNGEDRTLFAVTHNTNDIAIQTNEDLQRLTENFYLKVHSFYPYTLGKNESGETIVIKDKMSCMASLWKRNYYGDEVMLETPFIDNYGNKYKYINMSTLEPSSKSTAGCVLRFALQHTDNYQILQYWPEDTEKELSKKKKLVVLNSTIYGSVIKPSGVFVYDTESAQWIQVQDEQYYYLNSIKQFSYDSGDGGHTYYSIEEGTKYYDNPDFTGEHEANRDYEVERDEDTYKITIDSTSYYVKPEDVQSIIFYVEEDFVGDDDQTLYYGNPRTISDLPYTWMDSSMDDIRYQRSKALLEKTVKIYLKIDNTESEEDENSSQTTQEKVTCQVLFDQ